jgi:hypothetical protein
MAQISQKPLLDQDSQTFLESRGLINISNSFPGSAWRFLEINSIINLDIDTTCKNEKEFIQLIYKIGYENGFNYANSISDFESVIK